LQKYRFQRKILLSSILVVTVVFFIMTGVFSWYIIRTSRDAFEEQVDVQLRGITSQLENTLRLADDIALQIGADYQIIEKFSDIRGYGGEENYFVHNAAEDYALKKHMMSYILKQNFIGRICLFDKKQNMTYVGRAVDYGFLKKDCPDRQMFTDIASFFSEGKGANLYLISRRDPYVKEPVPVISVIREIKDYQLLPSNCVGYVQVQIRFDSFSHFGKTLGKDTECFILDYGTDEILCSFQSSRSGESLKELLAQQNGFTADGLYCRTEELPEYGLKVFIVSQNTSLITSLVSTFTWMSLLLVSIVLINFISQRQIIRRTTEPIVRMCDMLDGLQVDENLQEIPLVAHAEADELRRLNRAFDELVKNLKLSMEKEMASRINELQSQMFALQTQMNPHFIHNILTIISAMSGTEERDKIPEICEKLSDMIRYNTSYETSYGNLKSEIRHAENYLELMKIRYEDNFCYSLDYVGEDAEFHLPRFIIQPLLENCFIHGFKTKDFPWEMNIQVYVSGERWEIRVQDNGCGMEAEKLNDLKEELHEMRRREMSSLMQELKIGGLSVRNVYVRLYIAYGEDMIFEIESSRAGTGITVGGKI